MNIVEIAKQYFKLHDKGNGIYEISTPDGQFDSVVLWEKTNSYRRFSIAKSGGIKEFLKYIVGLNDSQISEEYGDIAEDNLTRALRWYKRTKDDTGLSLSDVVFERGYNTYIESRMITQETADYFHLEINKNDVAIPLYSREQRRIGSLYRNSSPDCKGNRYRTILAGLADKPCCWSFLELNKLKSNSVIVLVEGAWSAMRIHQVIRPHIKNIVPIATLGTNLTDELRDYIYDFPVVSIIDEDTGGKTVIETLNKWKAKKMKIEYYMPSYKKLTMQEQSSYVDDLPDEKLKRLFYGILRNSSILSL